MMARGWESKSVEAQQDEAARAPGEKEDRPLSEEERERHQRRQALALARARTAADLVRAAAPAQQEMLRQALAALDAQLGGT
ncbi:MAG: hypothetical protein AB1806_07425 [Acidobacteriota bacterium]